MPVQLRKRIIHNALPEIAQRLFSRQNDSRLQAGWERNARVTVWQIKGGQSSISIVRNAVAADIQNTGEIMLIFSCPITTPR